MSTNPIITDEPITPAQASSSLKSRLRLHRQFASQLMDEKRDFVGYRAPQYEAEPDRRYPVLYLQDGQNLFDPDTSFIPGKYWRVGETADELIVGGLAYAPILAGDEGSIGIEQVLAVLQVQHRIAPVGLSLVLGRKVNHEVALLVHQLGGELPMQTQTRLQAAGCLRWRNRLVSYDRIRAHSVELWFLRLPNAVLMRHYLNRKRLKQRESRISSLVVPRPATRHGTALLWPRRHQGPGLPHFHGTIL